MATEFVAVECDDGKGSCFHGGVVNFLSRRTGSGFLVLDRGGTPEPGLRRLEETTEGPIW